MAEIFLKRLIYQPLHLHTAQFQVFMPACKCLGTIRGGVWVSAEVSGGAPKGADVLQFPPQLFHGLSAKQPFCRRLLAQQWWFRVSPLCATSWLSTKLGQNGENATTTKLNSACELQTKPITSSYRSMIIETLTRPKIRT